MRLHYVTDFEAIGNAYGYAVHNRQTRAALARAGVGFAPDAPVAFHVASPQVFDPLPGRFNVLFVAWESDRLPACEAASVRRADLVLVTAPFLVPVFRDALGAGAPLAVAPLGVDASAWPYRRRRRDRREPFRYLWVGAPNARKGYELVLRAWQAFRDRDDAELVLKTTMTDRRERRGNVVFDSRKLPRPELLRLLHSAHAFVFPSFGEGFGLTLFEALASGCPAIWTHATAPADFLTSAHGWPLGWDRIPTPVGGMARARLPELVRAMRDVRQAYDEGRAHRKSRRAARHVARTLTWERTARAVLEALGRHAPGFANRPPDRALRHS